MVKVLHDGVERRVLADLELIEAIASYVEQQDPVLVQLRPTVIVGEFSQMLHDAIDLSQELRNLQRLRAELRRRTGRGHPDAVSRKIAGGGSSP